MEKLSGISTVTLGSERSGRLLQDIKLSLGENIATVNMRDINGSKLTPFDHDDFDWDRDSRHVVDLAKCSQDIRIPNFRVRYLSLR